MTITPLEIQKKTFSKVFRGYEEAEVESFLEEVASFCTKIVKENNELKDKVREQDIRISELVDREKTVNSTLSVVRKLSDEMKDNAKRQSDTIVAQARSRAKEIYLRLQDEAKSLKMEIEHYKIKRDETKKSLIQFLRNQIAVIDRPQVDGFEGEKKSPQGEVKEHNIPELKEGIIKNVKVESRLEC